MSATRYIVCIFPAMLMALGTNVVFGQDYPNKPIRIFTGGVGGSNDQASRLIGQGLSGPLGQAVIVENRGATLLAAQAVASAPPDGYNLVLAGDLMWLNSLLRGLPDAMVNFAPISMLASAPNLLAVHPSLPVKTLKELIALAKARPGELNNASASPGGIDHLAPELFKAMTGAKIVIIHYKGGVLSTSAVASGEAHFGFNGLAVSTPHIKSGKLRPVAVTSAKQSVLAPGVPTLAETGLPGFDLAGVDSIYATAKTPAAIVNRLNQEIVRFLRTKDAYDKYLSMGAEVVASSPEEHAATIKSRVSVIGKLVKDAGIKIE